MEEVITYKLYSSKPSTLPNHQHVDQIKELVLSDHSLTVRDKLLDKFLCHFVTVK